jgi:hypothetical protein
VRDHRDRDAVVVQGRDREAHPVERDGSLLDHRSDEVRGHADANGGAADVVGCERGHGADAVDVALNQVSTQPSGERDRSLQVDAVPRLEP